ncbi:MAG: DUF1893 domain-containing protein [Clostridia bacterium]|nr:DUF1893 domain-containing protein [Clostridia bacterium]
MTDIEKAKQLLAEGSFTFVAVNGTEVRTSAKRGIAPVLELIDSEPEFFKNASVADKVIGKATAMLMTAYGVKEIYTPLTSDNALNYIKDKQTVLEYEKNVDHIINRDGTDMCPMEKTVLHIFDEKEAERLIRNKLDEMRRA